MDINNCLTAEEMSTVCTVFIECFEIEISKIPAVTISEVETFLLEHASLTKLHTLFTSGGVKAITEKVFDSVDIRDFILCLTDQFNFITALSNFEKRSIEYSIAYGLGEKEKSEEQLILMPERVYNSIEKDGDMIYRVLCSNSWLVTLVLIYSLFQKTALSAKTTQKI